MSDFQTKADNYKKAVNRLEESIKEYDETHSDSVRDDAIQRFEFCIELAWKTIREYLLDQGFSDLNSPKSVMREAYAYHVIDDEKLWISALGDRNLTSHVYDEKTADDIYLRICGSYIHITIHPKQVYCIIRPPIFPYNFLGKGGLFLCQLRSTPVSPLRKRTAKV